MNLLELETRITLVNRFSTKVVDFDPSYVQDSSYVLNWCQVNSFPPEVLFGLRPAFAKEIARRVIQLLVTATTLKQIDLPLDPA